MRLIRVKIGTFEVRKQFLDKVKGSQFYTNFIFSGNKVIKFN